MHKLIDRNKFHRKGMCDWYKCDKDDYEYGMVYNCDYNIANMNILEYIYFYSEFAFHKKSNILWSILFLICPWYKIYYEIFYKDVKKYGLSHLADISIAEFFTMMLMTGFVVLCLGPIFAVIISIVNIIDKKKIVKKIVTKGL